jgi:hypothetical protein
MSAPQTREEAFKAMGEVRELVLTLELFMFRHSSLLGRGLLTDLAIAAENLREVQDDLDTWY